MDAVRDDRSCVCGMQEYKLPVIIAINKVDVPGVNTAQLKQEIAKTLGVKLLGNRTPLLCWLHRSCIVLIFCCVTPLNTEGIPKSIVDLMGRMLCVEISARERTNLTQLQDMIISVTRLLQPSADILAVPEGAVIEAFKEGGGRGKPARVACDAWGVDLLHGPALRARQVTLLEFCCVKVL